MSDSDDVYGCRWIVDRVEGFKCLRGDLLRSLKSAIRIYIVLSFLIIFSDCTFCERCMIWSYSLRSVEYLVVETTYLLRSVAVIRCRHILILFYY